MKTNKFILAAILTIFLFLMTGSAGADLLYVGTVEGAFFSADDTVGIIYDDAQNLVWADYTTLDTYNWYDALNWSDGIYGNYSWFGDPLEFSGGWRLPTINEFLDLWFEGMNNIPEIFGSLYEENYWTATQILFSMQSGEPTSIDPLDLGYALAVRDVVPDSQVPEPSSLTLLALGFLSLSGVIRFRKIAGRG